MNDAAKFLQKKQVCLACFSNRESGDDMEGYFCLRQRKLLEQCVKAYADPECWKEGKFNRLGLRGRAFAVETLKRLNALPEGWELKLEDWDFDTQPLADALKKAKY